MNAISPLSRRTLLKTTAAATAVASIAGVAPGFVRPAAAQDAKLTIWDNWTRDVDSAVIEALNAKFIEAHPGVTIERVTKSFNDLKATAKLAMSSPDGPDLIQINQGLSDMGAMAEGGILTDLTPYVQKYKWDEKLAPGIAARNSFSADGKIFGEGVIFGMPITAEFIGVYYNKGKFEQLGLEVPKTFAEFEALLNKAKDAGEIPIAFGDLDAYPAIHTYGELQGLYVNTEYLDNFIYGRNNVSFDTPENIKAADKLVEWNNNGMFTPDFLGIGYDDAAAAFKAGQGVTLITGSWLGGDLAAVEDQEFGFFLVPSETEGGNKPVVSGTSLSYAIRKGSANADLAAEYIDFLVSDAATEDWAAIGIVPIGIPEKVEEGTLYADLSAAWTDINTNDRSGHYLDWATPTFYDTLTAGLTELLGGVATPEEFVAKMQADYGPYVASKTAS